MDTSKMSTPPFDPFRRANARYSLIQHRRAERAREIDQEKADLTARIRSILMNHLPADRLTVKDTLSYLAFQVDDCPRKTICRFYFGKRKYIAFLTEDRSLEKIILGKISNLGNFSLRITEKAVELSRL